MRRTVIIGVITFLLGAATAPRAANQDETLKLMCKRWKEADGDLYHGTMWPQRDSAIIFVGRMVCGDK